MIGNISKSKGFKGDSGFTPSITFRYDPETGNLYYSSDGILISKNYISSNNLVTKEDIEDIQNAILVHAGDSVKHVTGEEKDVWNGADIKANNAYTLANNVMKDVGAMVHDITILQQQVAEYGQWHVSHFDRIAALEALVDRLLVKTVTISLLASKWVEDEGRYAQVITLPNITPYSKVDLQLTAEQLTIFHEKDIAFVTENDNGIVTVFCIGQKPTNDYMMQATVTEVAHNG